MVDDLDTLLRDAVKSGNIKNVMSEERPAIVSGFFFFIEYLIFNFLVERFDENGPGDTRLPGNTIRVKRS
jgi:hypothetical protein